jgi:hypothetical protein
VEERGAAAMAGLDAVESAVFALLGLLLAFSVSGALQRFDERRLLILQEANAIGTAYDRLDLLQPEASMAAKAKLKAYLQARIDTYRQPLEFSLINESAVYSDEFTARTTALKSELWTQVVGACPNATYNTTCSILLPTLTSVFEVGLQRRGANERHPPAVIFAMLFGLGLIGSLLAGFGMAAAEKQSRLHVFAFAFALAFALYVVVNLEFPRLGFIHVGYFDHFLVEMLAKMN